MQKIAGSFLPIGETIRLHINVVLGQKYKAMAYQAFLPDFNISFSYSDKLHFYSLLNAFVLNALSEMSLREEHSLLFDYESFEQYKIKVDASALSLSYCLLARFMPYESFPGKAFKFLGNVLRFKKNRMVF
jgi:hypothetical protein